MECLMMRIVSLFCALLLPRQIYPLIYIVSATVLFKSLSLRVALDGRFNLAFPHQTLQMLMVIWITYRSSSRTPK